MSISMLHCACRQDRMYKDMRKHFETFSMEGGGKSKNLFDVIQRTIVAVLLSEMFGCSLPDDVMLDVQLISFVLFSSKPACCRGRCPEEALLSELRCLQSFRWL